jgi:hypothetical protein
VIRQLRGWRVGSFRACPDDQQHDHGEQHATYRELHPERLVRLAGYEQKQRGDQDADEHEDALARAAGKTMNLEHLLEVDRDRDEHESGQDRGGSRSGDAELQPGMGVVGAHRVPPRRPAR